MIVFFEKLRVINTSQNVMFLQRIICFH